MTAVQVPLEELMRWIEPPSLDARSLDRLEVREVEELLVARLRVFLRHNLDWRQALLLAVTPDA